MRSMPRKRNGEPIELEVFAFMTTMPNELVATINRERMPVQWTGDEQFETWLTFGWTILPTSLRSLVLG